MRPPRRGSSPNDAQRIQRALEVFRITGKPLSALQGARVADSLPFRFMPVALIPSDRAVLHRRIELRFDAMLAAGLVEELAALRGKYALDPGPAVDALRRLPPGLGTS